MSFQMKFIKYKIIPWIKLIFLKDFLNYVFGAECVLSIIENILSAMNFVSIWELLVHNGQY